MLPRCDQIQVCTEENSDYLESFLPGLAPRLDAGLRAGIDTARYHFRPGGREPLTMLFLGSFRHTPNQVALDWFARFVLPLIVAKLPQARLLVAGSDPPPAHTLPIRRASDCSDSWKISRAAVALRGIRVPDPQRSGVRVKLLEAFATGIPVVSTTSAPKAWRARTANSARWPTIPGLRGASAGSSSKIRRLAAEMAARAQQRSGSELGHGRDHAQTVESYQVLVQEKRS